MIKSKNHIAVDLTWCIRETNKSKAENAISESLFSLANGYMGLRGCVSESDKNTHYCAGTHVVGVYVTQAISHAYRRKNFPRTTDRMVNLPDWSAIRFSCGQQSMNSRNGRYSKYERCLDMRRGVLTRRFIWHAPDGRKTCFEIERFVSLADPHLGAIRYCFIPLNYSGKVSLESGINADIKIFADLATRGRESPAWCLTEKKSSARDGCLVSIITREAQCQATIMAVHQLQATAAVRLRRPGTVSDEKYIARKWNISVKQGQKYCLDKFVYITSSLDTDSSYSPAKIRSRLSAVRSLGFEEILNQHYNVWSRIWDSSDIVVEGDSKIQKQVRFSIFQMHQQWRSNVPTKAGLGAKGLSGCGYFGWVFWDTDIYMLPFYLFSEPEAARKLLSFRYQTLDKARQNARSYGYAGARFPWSTVKGDECCPPWEYVMGEIHITADIAYAVLQYLDSSDDNEAIATWAGELLIEMARYWSSRVAWNKRRRAYVINFVIGPDEYTMFVNNNCFTNALVKYTLEATCQRITDLAKARPGDFARLKRKLGLNTREIKKWRDISRRILIPFDEKLGIHLQDDGMLDREAVDVVALKQRGYEKLEGTWPNERLFRTNIIKQADTVMLMLLLEEQFDKETIKKNYQFYEPLTIHNSSLSLCAHSIVAARLGMRKQSYDYFLKSAGLDLDQNDEPSIDGIHLANCGGVWMCLINGFAGMRIVGGRLCFQPHLPRPIRSLAFKVLFRGRVLSVKIKGGQTIFLLLKGEPLTVKLNNKNIRLQNKKETVIG